MWQYVVTFAGSLSVALISLWISHWWSDKRSYNKALKSLRNEVSTNVRVCKLVCDGIDKELEFGATGQVGLTPYPRFYNSVWSSARQAVPLRTNTMSEALEDAYIMLDVINEFLRRIEDLKHGIEASLVGGTGNRTILTLQITKGFIETKAVPLLENAKAVLDEEIEGDSKGDKAKMNNNIKRQDGNPSKDIHHKSEAIENRLKSIEDKIDSSGRIQRFSVVYALGAAAVFLGLAHWDGFLEALGCDTRLFYTLSPVSVVLGFLAIGIVYFRLRREKPKTLKNEK